jgi:type IV pilus assembly protein PilQ
MRLRQLLGIIVLVAATTALAVGAEPVAAKTITETRRVSHISSIIVVQGKDGLNVEVSGDSSMTAKAIKLTGPDRIVLDIADSVLTGHSRQIPVNSGDLKDVRAAHYQDAPPTTRVVLDMSAMRDFEVVPAGNKLVLKLKNTDAAFHPVSVSREAVAQQAPAAVVRPEIKAAATAVQPEIKPEIKMVAAKIPQPTQPTAASKPAENTDLILLVAPDASSNSGGKKEVASSQAKSDQAATHFVKPAAPALVSANQPPLPGNAGLSAQPAVVNAALQQHQQAATQTVSASTASSCTSGHYSGAPLNLDLKDLDIKDFFRLIHEISGLNVVLDPGVKGIVTIDVTDIPWDQALAIVLRNNGLECELEGNVLRVATLETLRAEADARRAQQEAQAMAVPRQNYTRYLSYAHSKDVVTILKKFLSPRGDAVSDDRSNAVMIEDIPTTLPKIDALLTALDRKTPEVEIEARVVSAQRTFAQDIGTQLGFGWGNHPTAVGGGTGVPSPIQTNVTNPLFLIIPGQAAQIPLFSNLPATNPTSGISFTTATSNYRLDFVLSMAESRGLVKILSRPRVVTQNNISALIRQGQRIPVVTLSQLGGPPTVTYVDAFLRLTVTPQITSDNTIFLLLDVENTTPDFSHVTGQQLNPTLDTQQTTTQVLVSDGQTVVIGGVIQTQNSVAINQVPLLGSIPLLGNLFKHTSINTSTAELLFFVTPKIIQT